MGPGDAPAHETYAAKKPVFAGKVTCGVRNETSGQSWVSNTLATGSLTGVDQPTRSSVLALAGELHVRFGVQGL
jgi:hypothetical protein